MRPTPTIVRGYDRLAPIYDPLAALYSGGRIGGCHRAVAERLTHGETALFVGVGSGRDAAHAVRRGVRARLLDSSPAMLARARARIAQVGPPFEVPAFAEDVRTFTPPAPFDAVVASFFLNVFRPDEVDALLARFHHWLRPGGRLLVADFAAPRGGRLARSVQRLYHDLPMHVFRALTGNARHAIHDLPPRLVDAGFGPVERSAVRVFGRGPAWLEVLEARRAESRVVAPSTSAKVEARR